MYTNFVNQTQVNSLISNRGPLSSFMTNLKCAACEVSPTKGAKCCCAFHTNEVKEILFENILEEFSDKKSQIAFGLIKAYLPTCINSMVSCISEENAKLLEDGKAKVEISPLSEINLPYNQPLALYVNGDLVFVSALGTYTECAEMLATYMGSY